MPRGNGNDYSNIIQPNEEEREPWWNKDPETPSPFNLVRKLLLNNGGDLLLHSLAIYPWDDESLSKLWGGALNFEENVAKWKKEVVSEFWDSVAVGSAFNLYVCFTHKLQQPLCTILKDKQTVLPADKMCVAWGLAKDQPFQPLVIFSRGSLIFIYNVVQKGISGCIRGHGAAITSISVHPTTPHLFCTTSRDFTTRIYDLGLTATFEMLPLGNKNDTWSGVPNPPWPPIKGPSLAGAAHGLRLPFSMLEGTGEREGGGRGRCVSVLMGGRSAGHTSAVLASAFHPTHPLIATCGMDRTVKIWPVRSSSETMINREDKPLLSSGMVHKARVLSISWLDSDLLLSHSAPAIMRYFPDKPDDKTTYLEAGELIMWRWLGLDRFFPAGHEQNTQGLRGCSSDYQESSSLKIISIHRFPEVADQYITPNLSLFQSHTHDPLVSYLYPGATSISLLPVTHMEPRPCPPFRCEAEKKLLGDPEVKDANGTSLAEAAGRLRLAGPNGAEEDDDEEDEEAQFEDEANDDDLIDGKEKGVDITPPGIDCHTLAINEKHLRGGETLQNCAVGMDGQVVVGVGTKGSVWVWRYREPVIHVQ